MKKIFILAIFCLPIFFTGCQKRIIDTDVSIYGIVYDADTYNPIQGAKITLMPSGRNEVTSSAGAYEFNDLDISVKKYTVSVSATDYHGDSRYVVLNPGESSKVDFALKKE